jgi:hypothetical protein
MPVLVFDKFRETFVTLAHARGATWLRQHDSLFSAFLASVAWRGVACARSLALYVNRRIAPRHAAAENGWQPELRVARDTFSFSSD